VVGWDVGAVLGIGRVFQMGIGMGMVDGMRGDTCDCYGAGDGSVYVLLGRGGIGPMK
jgi:hypothetical protein